MSTLTWLHLSDLHAQSADKFNRDKEVFEALFADIERRINEDGLKPNFIVFTGDLAYHGRPEEYELVMKHFFEPLLARTGLSPGKLFIVPGNHDMDWDVVELLSSDTARSLNDRDSVNQFLAPEKESHRRVFFQPLEGYARFVEKNFAQHWIDECDSTFACVRFHEYQADDGNTKKVALLGLNSAWLSGFVRDAQGQVTDRGNLLVGERQVYKAVEQAKDANICIALMHHPFEWLREFDRIDVESRLRRACHFILHGHMRGPRFAAEDTLEGKTIITRTGAAYDRHEFPNGYNFVQLDLEMGEGTIYLRRYNDSRREWVKDIEATGEDQDGQIEFTWVEMPSTGPAPEEIASLLVVLEPSLRSFEQAFSRIIEEVEWVNKIEGRRLRDTSFDVIDIRWRDCRRGFYSELIPYRPSAKSAVPSLEERFSTLERGVEELDIAIKKDNRGDLLHAVENLDNRIQDFRKVVKTIAEEGYSAP